MSTDRTTARQQLPIKLNGSLSAPKIRQRPQPLGYLSLSVVLILADM